MRAAIGALLVLFAVPAVADTSPADTFTVRGFGGISCGRWTADRREAGLPAIADQNWVLGFVTGYDAFEGNGDVGRDVDNDALAAWLDTYCQAHPLDNLATASQRLVEALRDHQP